MSLRQNTLYNRAGHTRQVVAATFRFLRHENFGDNPTLSKRRNTVSQRVVQIQTGLIKRFLCQDLTKWRRAKRWARMQKYGQQRSARQLPATEQSHVCVRA